MKQMSENDFYELNGNSYRGSRYANFTGGGTTPQGNVSSAATENAINKVGTSADASQDAPPTPVTPSKGLTADVQPAPSMTKQVIGAALPFVGSTIGQAAGAAIGGAGATFGEGIRQGVSSLANTVSGGLIGTASSPGSIVANSGATQTTKAAYDAASASSNVGKLGSGANLGAAAGAGIATAAATLLTGGGVKKAATAGIGAAAGTAIGTAVGGPVGGFIGGSIGGSIGGRVICTQLVKDGLLDKADQRLDMEFTFRALSNIHVRGYLFWARGWVELMKKNPKLRDRTLKVVVWRLNEIKYLIGERENSDWRGKIVRLIMENLCFIIGLFVAETAESEIYKKENPYVST